MHKHYNPVTLYSCTFNGVLLHCATSTLLSSTTALLSWCDHLGGSLVISKWMFFFFSARQQAKIEVVFLYCKYLARCFRTADITEKDERIFGKIKITVKWGEVATDDPVQCLWEYQSNMTVIWRYRGMSRCNGERRQRMNIISSMPLRKQVTAHRFVHHVSSYCGLLGPRIAPQVDSPTERQLSIRNSTDGISFEAGGVFISDGTHKVMMNRGCDSRHSWRRWDRRVACS